MKKHSLRICYTADCHGHFYPVDYATGKAKASGLINAISRFEKDGNTLIIDGGDSLQGSPFVQRLVDSGAGAGAVAEVMNLGGYDFVTLGNHDFNYGYDFLASYLSALDARCLCSNIADVSGELPIFGRHIHTTEDGLRVGLVGVCTDWVTRWENPKTTARFRVEKVMECLPRELAALREEADILVGIYHGGFENDITTHEPLTDTDENVAFAICRELDFDLLLTGHQHKPFAGTALFGTHVVQTPSNAAAFALVEVSGEKGNWEITSQLVPAGDKPYAPAYEALLPQEEATQAWLDTPVGWLPQPLLPGDRIEMALHGSPLADFINRLRLEYTGADVAVCSHLNDPQGLPQEVTRRNIAALAPYPGTQIIRRVNGAVLRAALERSGEYFAYDNGVVTVSKAFLEPKVEHYNFDFFLGVDYAFNPAKPVGSRLTHLRFQGRDLADDQELLVCLTNYRSSGTGGYEMYLPCPVVDEYPADFAELLIRWFSDNPRPKA